MPFDAIGAGVPLGSLLAAKVRWVVEFSTGTAFQRMLALVLRAIDAFEVAEIIVERIAIPVMDFAAVWHRAVMMLPHRAMKVGWSRLSPLMAAVIIAR
jgi:hypothetical protein